MVEVLETALNTLNNSTNSEVGKFSYFCKNCKARITRKTEEELVEIGKICSNCREEMESQVEEEEEIQEEEEIDMEHEVAQLTEHERGLQEFASRYLDSRQEKGKGKGKKGKVEMENPPCPVHYDLDEEECGDMEMKEMVEFSLNLINNGSSESFYSREGEEEFSTSFYWMAGTLRAARSGFDEKVKQRSGGFGITPPQLQLKRGFLETALSCIGECKKLDENNNSALWENQELLEFMKRFDDDSNLRRLIGNIIDRAKVNPRIKYPTYLPGYEPPGKNIWNQPINAQGEVIERVGKGKGKLGKGKDSWDETDEDPWFGNEDEGFWDRRGKDPWNGKGKDPWSRKGKDPLNWKGKGKSVKGKDSDGKSWPAPGGKVGAAWDIGNNQPDTQIIAEVVRQSILPIVDEVRKLADQQPRQIQQVVPQVHQVPVHPGFPQSNIIKNQSDQSDPYGIRIQALEAGILKTSQQVMEIGNNTKDLEQKMNRGLQGVTNNFSQMFEKLCTKMDSLKEPQLDNNLQPEPIDFQGQDTPKPISIKLPNAASPQVPKFTLGPSSSSGSSGMELLNLEDWPEDLSKLRELMEFLKSSKVLSPQQEVQGLTIPALKELKESVVNFYVPHFKTFPNFMNHVKEQISPPALMDLDDSQIDDTNSKKALQCVICLKYSTPEMKITSPAGKCWASCSECRYERQIWPVYKAETGKCLVCEESNYFFTSSTRNLGVCYGCDKDESRAKVKSIVKCIDDCTFYIKFGLKSMKPLKHEQVREFRLNKKGEKLSLEACPNNEVMMYY